MCAPAAPAVMTGSPGAQPQPHCCSSHPAGVLVELISNISLPFGERVHRLYSKKFLIFKCESALELNNNKKKIQQVGEAVSFLSLEFLQVKTRISLCKCNTEERAGQWLSGRKRKKFYIGRKARYVPEKSVEYS